MKTNAMEGAAVAAIDDGLRKEAAAELVGCSVRQIERFASEGLVRKWTPPKAPNERTAPVVYSRADLLAVKSGAKATTSGESVAKTARLESGSKAEVNRVLPGAAEILAHIAAALALPAPQSLKPWLSIPEAAEFSGLPAAFLRARAPELARVGAAVNTGRGNSPRWRILRSQLERGFPVSASAGN